MAWHVMRCCTCRHHACIMQHACPWHVHDMSMTLATRWEITEEWHDSESRQNAHNWERYAQDTPRFLTQPTMQHCVAHVRSRVLPQESKWVEGRSRNTKEHKEHNWKHIVFYLTNPPNTSQTGPLEVKWCQLTSPSIWLHGHSRLPKSWSAITPISQNEVENWTDLKRPHLKMVHMSGFRQTRRQTQFAK